MLGDLRLPRARARHRPARPAREWARRRPRLPAGMTLVSRCETSVRRPRPSAAGAPPPARPRRSGPLAAPGLHRSACGSGGRHPGARRASITAATASISSRSFSSASSAASPAGTLPGGDVASSRRCRGVSLAHGATGCSPATPTTAVADLHRPTTRWPRCSPSPAATACPGSALCVRVARDVLWPCHWCGRRPVTTQITWWCLWDAPWSHRC